MPQELTDEDKLMIAVFNRDVKGIELFANPGNVNKIYYDRNENRDKNIGYTLLEYAAHYGSVDSIKTLLKKGANVNHENQYALHFATSNYPEKLTSVEALLNGGADVNKPDKDGMSPLHLAIYNRHNESAKFLLEKEANIHLCDKEGNTPLHIAAERGNFEAVILLKDKGAIFDVINNAGMKPLALAQNALKTMQDRKKRPGDPSSLKRIVGLLGADTWDHYIIPPADKEVVLASAELIRIFTSNDDQDTKARDVKKLLASGVDPNINIETLQGKSPILQYFVYDGNLGAVKHLLEIGADVNQDDKDGDTALHVLAQSRAPHSQAKMDILKLLLENGGDLNKKNNAGKTPFDCAVENGQKEIANQMRQPLLNFFPWSEEINDAIVAKANADLIKTTLSDDAPDIKAKAIKELLDLGANPNIRLTTHLYETTILSCFVDDLNFEAVKHLLDKKADVNQGDEIGDTALHDLAKNSTNDPETKIDILKLLLRNGGDLNKKNVTGKTPLDCALENGQDAIVDHLHKIDKANIELIEVVSSKDSPDTKAEAIKNLLYLGADPNTRLTEHNKNPILQYCVYEGNLNLEAARHLLKEGAKVNDEDATGDTALHVLAQAMDPDSKTKIDILKLLLENGGDLNKENNAGKTPLECALENKQKEIFHEIIKYAKEHNIKFSNRVNRAIEKEVNDDLLKVVSSKDSPDTKAEAIKNLLYLGADPNTRLTEHNKNPILQYCVYEGNLGAVKLLLEKGAKVDENDLDGDTALHVLAQARDPDSKTKIDILKLLLSKGGDLNKENNAGKTPLECALENRQKEIADEIITYVKEHNIKFSDRVNLAIVKKANDDLLKVISSNDNQDNKAKAIEKLLELGANPNITITTGNRNPIIQYFVDEVNLKAVKCLLEKGANVNEKDATGNTALHVLAQASTPNSQTKMDILELLLRNGGDLDINNNAGKTPFNCAMDNQQEKIAYALMDRIPNNPEIASSVPSFSPSSPSREGSPHRR
jgi:ankyrin repeat protein